jgi:hypothetical protein
MEEPTSSPVVTTQHDDHVLETSVDEEDNTN